MAPTRAHGATLLFNIIYYASFFLAHDCIIFLDIRNYVNKRMRYPACRLHRYSVMILMKMRISVHLGIRVTSMEIIRVSG